MTITEPSLHLPSAPVPVPPAVAIDLYRDIHKAIRVDLFGLTAGAGRLDPGDDAGRADFAARVRASIDLLEVHATHEDEAIAPVVAEHLPRIGDRVAADHLAFEGRGEHLCALATAAAEASCASGRDLLHQLYLDLAGFTSTYLAHQDLEERELMPALAAAVGPEHVFAIHQEILAGIPPEEMAASLAMMIPAMNVDDRTELLGGMQAGAPPEVFDGVWALVASVLPSEEHATLGRRLGR